MFDSEDDMIERTDITFRASSETMARDFLYAAKYRMILFKLDEYLRGKIKHGNDFESIEDALQKVRDELYNISTDEIPGGWLAYE